MSVMQWQVARQYAKSFGCNALNSSGWKRNNPHDRSRNKMLAQQAAARQRHRKPTLCGASNLQTERVERVNFQAVLRCSSMELPASSKTVHSMSHLLSLLGGGAQPFAVTTVHMCCRQGLTQSTPIEGREIPNDVGDAIGKVWNDAGNAACTACRAITSAISEEALYSRNVVLV